MQHKEIAGVVENHKEYAFKIAARYDATTMVDRDDLQQAALIGLYKAAVGYDPNNTGNAAFTTYAYRVIANQIVTELRRWRRDSVKTSLELVSAEPAAAPEDHSVEIIDALRNSAQFTAFPDGLQALFLAAEGHTQAEIGKRLGFSQGKACRVLRKAREIAQEVVSV